MNLDSVSRNTLSVFIKLIIVNWFFLITSKIKKYRQTSAKNNMREVLMLTGKMRTKLQKQIASLNRRNDELYFEIRAKMLEMEWGISMEIDSKNRQVIKDTQS